MASLLTLKRRITAAQNVSKTTRAMQMIAASKLKKAQDAALSARGYAQKLISLSQNVSVTIENRNLHPYMSSRKDAKKSLLVVVAPDKGLCGGLITNLLKRFMELRQQTTNFEYIVVGKKVEGKIIHFGNGDITAAFPFGTTLPSFDMVYPIIRIIDDLFTKKRVDSVEILYSNFVSIFTQEPKVDTLLPITIANDAGVKKDGASYIFEPNLNLVLGSLLKHYLEMSVYSVLLENFASEQASRMIAMQNATTNAKEVIEELRLEYNKQRQAKITNEILDISNTGTSFAT